MTFPKTNRPCLQPRLIEVLKTSGYLNLPPYVMLETPRDFRLEFNLFGATQSLLHASATEDGRQLQVVGIKKFHDLTADFLWVFELPENVDVTEIRIVERGDIYVVHIPKQSREPFSLGLNRPFINGEFSVA